MGEPKFEKHEIGVSWLADTDERMERASHAVGTPDGYWVIDPVDVDGLDGELSSLGEPLGVIQLLDRHARDCAAVAGRLEVPHHEVPFDGVEGSPFEPITVVRNRMWNEVALWWAERRALIVAEAVGSTSYFKAGDEAIGTHPVMRFKPPADTFSPYQPSHLLTGHGTGMHGAGTAEALHASLDGARRGLPRAIVSLFRSD